MAGGDWGIRFTSTLNINGRHSYREEFCPPSTVMVMPDGSATLVSDTGAAIVVKVQIPTQAPAPVAEAAPATGDVEDGDCGEFPGEELQ